jgi:hypothetical protein
MHAGMPLGVDVIEGRSGLSIHNHQSHRECGYEERREQADRY